MAILSRLPEESQELFADEIVALLDEGTPIEAIREILEEVVQSQDFEEAGQREEGQEEGHRTQLTPEEQEKILSDIFEVIETLPIES